MFDNVIDEQSDYVYAYKQIDCICNALKVSIQYDTIHFMIVVIT